MSRKVLIVEDHPEHREYMVRVVRALGFTPLAAAAAEEGLHLARSERPVLILMDIVLREDDGRDAARRLKEEAATAAIPIIAVTGLAFADRGPASACDGYLRKPFTPSQLRAKLAEMLPLGE